MEQEQTMQQQLDEVNKGVMFENCAPFTDCLSEINNTQVDHTKDIDVVRLMHNLIQYCGKYLKTSESLRQHQKDESTDATVNPDSFKYQITITEKTTSSTIIFEELLECL